MEFIVLFVKDLLDLFSDRRSEDRLLDSSSVNTSLAKRSAGCFFICDDEVAVSFADLNAFSLDLLLF